MENSAWGSFLRPTAQQRKLTPDGGPGLPLLALGTDGENEGKGLFLKKHVQTGLAEAHRPRLGPLDVRGWWWGLRPIEGARKAEAGDTGQNTLDRGAQPWRFRARERGPWGSVPHRPIPQMEKLSLGRLRPGQSYDFNTSLPLCLISVAGPTTRKQRLQEGTQS